jgi:hypothetical protein
MALMKTSLFEDSMNVTDSTIRRYMCYQLNPRVDRLADREEKLLMKSATEWTRKICKEYRPYIFPKSKILSPIFFISDKWHHSAGRTKDQAHVAVLPSFVQAVGALIWR